jgi:hypothetical protein
VTVAPEKTGILDAALLIGAGIVAACQVGKAFIAMPLIIVDLKIGVDVGSMILAVVALIGAIGAMPVSMVLRRLGAGRARTSALSPSASAARLARLQRMLPSSSSHAPSKASGSSPPCWLSPIFCSKRSRRAIAISCWRSGAATCRSARC